MIALWRETRLYGEELCFGSSGCAGVEEVCTASSRKHIKAALWCRITRFLRKPVNRCDAFDIRRHHVFLLFCYRPLLKNSHITPFFSFTSSSVRVKFKPEMWFYDIIMLPLLWLCLFCCPLSGRAVCFSKPCNKCYRLFSPATNQYHARRKLRLHNAPKAITRIRMIEKKKCKTREGGEGWTWHVSFNNKHSV